MFLPILFLKSYHKINISGTTVPKKFQECVEKELSEYMENITVCNESKPLPLVEESVDAIYELFKVMQPAKTGDQLFKEVANFLS